VNRPLTLLAADDPSPSGEGREGAPLVQRHIPSAAGYRAMILINEGSHSASGYCAILLRTA
jgi:hypothetical protein